MKTLEQTSYVGIENVGQVTYERVLSSVIKRCVVRRKSSDVSKQHIASIFRVRL